jgi:MSHA biogenesis protein MshG
VTIYNYEGRDQNGKKVCGSLDADKTGDVVDFLKTKNIIPVTITVGKQKGGANDYLKSLISGKVKIKEVLNFSRQMATLINAGVPIIKAVKQLLVSAKSRGMRQTLSGIMEGIESGKGLAATLSGYPKVFSPIFVNLIAVGENIGHLDDVFLELSDFLQTKIDNHKRLIAAIRYPIIVIISICTAMLLMNFFVIPKFAALFLSFSTKLPLPTRVLIATSNFMVNHWLFLILFLIGVLVAISYLLSVRKIRFFWDKYKLKFPVLGYLQQRIILAQFTKTLSMILHSGVPMLKGIVLGANAAENKYIARQIILMRDAIDRGESFSRAATISDLFDGSTLQMMEVGEETGRLDEMLVKVAEIHEKEVDYQLKNLSALLEPMLLVIVGVMVALLALAIYLPMWDIVQFARQ